MSAILYDVKVESRKESLFTDSGIISHQKCIAFLVFKFIKKMTKYFVIKDNCLLN